MNTPNTEEMKSFSETINCLWKEGRMEEAKVQLLGEAAKYPEEYWLWTGLSQTCLGLGEYESALEYSWKAMNLCGNDVLVIYNHITALVNNTFYNESLPYCQFILRKPIKAIAQNGEGMKWAKSIRNDTMFLKAICLQNLGDYREALSVLRQLMALRQRGIYSDYSKKQIVNLKNKIEKHLIQEKNKINSIKKK